MINTIFAIVLITAGVKLFGFLREVLLAYYYGSSQLADYYNLTNIFPLLVFAPIGTAIAAAYIPVATSLKSKTEQFQLALQLALLLFFISILGWFGTSLFTENIVSMLSAAPTPEEKNVLNHFVQASFFAFPFAGVSLILIAYFQLIGSHIKANLSNLFLGLGVIVAIYFAQITIPANLAWATPLSYFLQFVFLFIFVLPYMKDYSAGLNLFKLNEPLKITLMHSAYVLPSLILLQTNGIVDRYLTSKLSVVGALSFISYADRIMTLIIGIFLLSTTSVLFPKFAVDAKSRDQTSYLKTIMNSLNISVFFVIPITIGLIFFSQEVVYVIYFRGVFDQAALIGTAGCLFYYSLGLLFIFIREILMKVIYAEQDWKKVVKITSAMVFSNFVFSYWLSSRMGVEGIALGTCLAQVLSVLVTVYYLRIGFSALFRFKNLLNVAIYTVAFLILAYLGKRWLYLNITDGDLPSKYAVLLVGAVYGAVWVGLFFLVVRGKREI